MRWIAVAALLSFVNAPAAAYQSTDCVEQIHSAALRHNVPPLLLYAIAEVESGQPLKKGQLDQVVVNKAARRPHAWSANVAGESMVFLSADAAISAVRSAQRRGVRSIDVGCMQVNLKHHPEAFRDLGMAFDPAANADYAASFLARLYRETGSWALATGRYHAGSAAAPAAWPYACRVVARMRAYGIYFPSSCDTR